jgi:hypothetical protein
MNSEANMILGGLGILSFAAVPDAAEWLAVHILAHAAGQRAGRRAYLSAREDVLREQLQP